MDYDQYIRVGGFADPGTAAAFMHACDWLVIPSRIESIPLIFVDAIHMRLPVIATEVGDLGALVRRFGIGTVAKPADPIDLANAIQTALSRPRSNFSGDWDKAEQMFNLRKTAIRCAESLAAISKVGE